MPPTIASAAFSDEEFLNAVESRELPLTYFRHGDHLRLAWLYLHREPFEAALGSVRRAIQGLAAHNHVSHIFHETLTTAWVMLLNTHGEATFDEFIEGNSGRLNQALLHRFWTPERLESEEARKSWVAPDRAALPN